MSNVCWVVVNRSDKRPLKNHYITNPSSVPKRGGDGWSSEQGWNWDSVKHFPKFIDITWERSPYPVKEIMIEGRRFYV